MSAGLLLLLAAVAAQEKHPAEHGSGPGTRAAVAGLAGFQVVSRIDYGDVQNRFTVAYVFPDRTRWHFENASLKGAPHRFFYRSGQELWELEGGASRLLPDEERDSLVRQMELRRAAFLWPDGFPWRAAERGTRKAVLHADSCCRARPLGELVAFLAKDRPTRIEVRDGAGELQETLAIQEWQERLGRRWPLELEITGEGGGFRETVESIETKIQFLDVSFVPPDRRPVSQDSAGGTRVLALDLVAVTYRPRDLAAGSSWEQALVRTRECIEEARAGGLAVDPVPTLELDAEGRPLRAWVRLKEPCSQPPEGFTSVAERAGLILALPALTDVGPAALARLRKSVPEGSRAGTPYLRLHARPNLPAELVLPLEPID